MARIPVPLFIRSAVTRAEGQWFDATRHVQTSGEVFLGPLGFTNGEFFAYVPVRPSVARPALDRLPLQNHAEYTFVDLGSGKGRMLFVAAEYPFRKIQGVELTTELHQQAEQNISLYRHGKRRCAEIQAIQQNATDYIFPTGKLVLYLCNPFGPEVLTKVFANLEKSLTEQPRHVILVLVVPVFASVFDAQPFLQLHFASPRYRIYQTVIR